MDLALVILAGFSVLVGMASAVHAARARRLSVVAWLGVIPALAFAAVLALGATRLSVSATYAQYHGGFGVLSIGASALGRGVLLMALVLAAGIAWTARALQLGAADPRERAGARPTDL